MIVGQISNSKEAKEIEFITKTFIVGNRARSLSIDAKRGIWMEKKEIKLKNKKSIPEEIEIFWVNITSGF